MVAAGTALALIIRMPRGTRRSPALLATLIPLLLVPVGCATRLVPLEPPARPPTAAAPPIEVVATVAGGSDPLRVDCGGFAFGGVARATGAYVAAAVEPWAERHREVRPGGWQLLVELTRSGAGLHDGVMTMELETRITLRARAGQLHLAQTRGYCKTVDTVAEREPTKVARQCLERMARDLGDWLEGVSP